MHQRFLPWLLLCALFATFSLHVQAAQGRKPTSKGTILVAKAEKANKRIGNGAVVPLSTNDPVEVSATVSTEAGGSLILVFSNGATTKLGENSELVIDEFLQDPFGNLRVSTTDKEPTQSSTKISLNRGELVGDVKLRDQDSEFIVNTPVGAAGIRGTVFRIVFRPDPNNSGKAFFQLTTASGQVVYTAPGTGGNANPVPGGTNASGSANVSVPQGQEVLIVDVNVTTNAQGQLVVTALPPPPTGASNANADAMRTATSVAVEIATATANTVFTTQGGTVTGSVTGNQSPTTQNFTTENAQGTVTVPPTPPQVIPASQLPSQP